jgi:hypothetical protein
MHGRNGSKAGSQDGAARSARRRKTAAPRLQRTLSGAANPGLGAGVRTTRDARTFVPAETNSRREGLLPEKPVTAHGATRSAGALDFTTASSWPRRAGVRPIRTHARTRIRLQGTIHRTGDRGTAPARHMARRRAAGWPSVLPTSYEARRRVHHHSRRREPGVATARRRFESDTGRRPFMEER